MALVAGLSIEIPPRGNVENNANSFKPMQVENIIGNTLPSLPYLPPPPKCNALAMVVMIAITVVATIATAGAAAAAMGGGMSTFTMGLGVSTLGGASVVGTGAIVSTIGGAAAGALAAAAGGFMGSVAGQLAAQLNLASHHLKNGWPRLEKRNNSVALLCNFSDAWEFLS